MPDLIRSGSVELTPLERELLDWVLAGGVHRPQGIHGIAHWGRVRAIGLALAPDTGADPRIVSLFALLHDVCRLSDGRDREHGPRAAELAVTLRDRFIPLDDAEFARLHAALKGHAEGRTSADPDIGTCWDSDRLDLPRVHIWIRRKYLSTAAAREQAMIRQAARAAVAGECPPCMQEILDRY